VSYDTTFYLTTEPPDQLDRIHKEMENDSPHRWAINTITAYGYLDETSWYDYMDDMKYLSEQFPDVTFILDGDGEDKDDLWRAYFKNGRAVKVHARITYDRPLWLA
jgi:GH35 family endo-1,4-beta-xylanase